MTSVLPEMPVIKPKEGELNVLPSMPYLQTPGGVSLKETTIKTEPKDPELEKVIGKDIFQQKIDDSLNLDGTGFVDKDIPIAGADGVAGSLDLELIEAVKTRNNIEKKRVEDVLFETVPNYVGTKVEGPLTLSQVDGLMRRDAGKQRETMFKKLFPEGKLFSAKVGDKTMVDLYQTSPNGRVYRLNNDIFSLGDIGKFTGTFATAQTAGAIVGSFFSPFIGTYLGAYVGDYLDDLADQSALGKEEFKAKVLSGDRALWSGIEALVAKVAPGAIQTLKRTAGNISGANIDPVTGLKQAGGSWWQTLGFGKPAENAWKLQASAQELRNMFAEYGVDLPLLNAAQVDGRLIVRGIANQISSTSGVIPKIVSKQKSKFLEGLDKHVASKGGDYNTLSEQELFTYLALRGDSLKDDLFESYGKAFFAGDGTVNKDVLQSAERLIKNTTKMKNGLNATIDKAYKKAFSMSDAESVVFNISEIKALATKLKKPIVARDVKGTPGPITKLDSRLEDLLDRIPNLADEVSAINISASTKASLQNVQSSFLQIKTLRDQVANLAYDDRLDQFSRDAAKDLLEGFDDLIINGYKKGLVTGGKKFLTEYQKAGKLFGAKKKAESINGLGRLLTELESDKTLLPQTLASKVLNGEFGAEEFEFFKQTMAKLSGGKLGTKKKQQIDEDIRTFAINEIISTDNPVEMIEGLLKRDGGKVFKQLFPNPAFRSATNNFLNTHKQLRSDAVTKVLEQESSNSAKGLSYIINKSQGPDGDLAVQKFIDENGGVDGKRAEQLRAALFRNILQSSTKVDDIIVGEVGVNPSVMATEMSDLLRALNNKGGGKYEALKPLFGKVDKNGKVKADPNLLKVLQNMSYYTNALVKSGDVGGAFQAGEVRAAIVGIPLTAKGAERTIGALQTLFTNEYLSRILASAPSVAQLKGMYTLKESARITRATLLLDNILNSLVDVRKEDGVYELIDATTPGDQSALDVDDQPAQTVTTQQPPINQVSQATLPFDRRTTVPPPAQQTGKGITNFASLFANDPIGEAIANRRLTQGIGSIG